MESSVGKERHIAEKRPTGRWKKCLRKAISQESTSNKRQVKGTVVATEGKKEKDGSGQKSPTDEIHSCGDKTSRTVVSPGVEEEKAAAHDYQSQSTCLGKKENG